MFKLFKCDFLFVDEVGVSLDPNQEYFGIGGLKINNNIELNRKLHDIFTGAASFLNQQEDRFEFKFKYITKNSLRFYKAILRELENYPNWQFAFVIKKKNKVWGRQTFWQEYIDGASLLLKKFSKNDIILIADFLAKPKKEKIDLFCFAKNNKKILNILQLESQGSLLLQVADILLGAVAYQIRIKNKEKADLLKSEISELAVKVLKNKNRQL